MPSSLHRVSEKLVKLTMKHRLKLRQGYPRVGKRALIKDHYLHAKQFKGAGRELRPLEDA